ncbi:MAG: DUF4097 family beta strand repeat-containing protein [Steroidobacter sp.]
MKKTIPLAALAGTLIALSAAAQDCKFSKDEAANIELGSATRVVIAAGAGELKVRGEENRTALNASGRACASSQELLDQMRLETRRDGDALYLRTIMPDMTDGLLGWRYAHLDLTVLIPKSTALSAEDSSGDLQVSSVQSATVTDSSGDQTIRDIAGDLDVTDSSGEIEIQRVGGTLRLKDSSGEIDVDEVRGDVEVSVDSSGDMKIERVAGSVHIANDSSGEIEITDVQRDVTIDADSSGGINVERIGGNFTVNTDGSGSINHDQVLGKVRVPEED